MSKVAVERFLFLIFVSSLEFDVRFLIKSESDFFFDLSFDLPSARLCTLKIIYRRPVALFEAAEPETDAPSLLLSTVRLGLGRTE